MNWLSIVFGVLLTGGVVTWLVVEIIKLVQLIKRRRAQADENENIK